MKPIPRFRTRPRLGLPSDEFRDPRSYVNLRTGRIVLRGRDYLDFRRKIYLRCGGHCEVETHGKRCNQFAPLDGIYRGELRHLLARGKGGSDIPENVEWSCGGHKGMPPQARPPRPRLD